MKKVVQILVIMCMIFFLGGCTNHSAIENKKIILADQYYATGGFLKSTSNEVKELLKKQESFLLFTYNNFCNMSVSCETIFEEFMKESNVRMYSIPFKDFRETPLYDTVKYAPSIIIIKKGKILTYLDANSDEDLKLYQNVTEFTNWIKQYVVIK